MAPDLGALRRAAEAEMARPAPDRPPQPPSKRRRQADGADTGSRSVLRYDYAAARDVRGPAFLISCAFRREKSAAQEAAAVLRQNLQPGSSSGGVQATGCRRSQQGAKDASGDSAHTASQLTPRPAAQAVAAALADGGVAEANLSDAGGPAVAASADYRAAADTAATAPPSVDRASSVQPEAADAAVTSRQGAAAAGDGHCSTGAMQPAAAEQQDADGAGDSNGGGGGTALAVVKLGVSGLMLLQAPDLAPGAAVAAVGALLSDIAAGRRQPLEHCRRIVPVEVIAPVEESALAAAAQSAAAVFLGSAAAAQLPRPCSYAVAYKHRRAAADTCPEATHKTGATVTEEAATAATAAAAATVPSDKQIPAQAEDSQRRQPEALRADGTGSGGGGGSGAALAIAASAKAQELGRGDAIRVMASAASSAASTAGLRANVNLQRPDWTLVAETLPVAGNSGMLVGLAAVPAAMLTLKPKLQIAATSAAAT